MPYKMHVWTATQNDTLHDQLRQMRDRVSQQNIEIAKLRKENEALRVKMEHKPMGMKKPEDWTLDEVVGALEHCSGKTCDACPLHDVENCGKTLMHVAAKMLREVAG